MTTGEPGRPDGRAEVAAAGGQVALSGRSVRVGDRVFSGLSRGSSIALLAVIAAIAAFLLSRTVPALQDDTVNFFTEKTWFPDSTPSVFGIAALTWGTLLSSTLALLLA